MYFARLTIVLPIIAFLLVLQTLSERGKNYIKWDNPVTKEEITKWFYLYTVTLMDKPIEIVIW